MIKVSLVFDVFTKGIEVMKRKRNFILAACFLCLLLSGGRMIGFAEEIHQDKEQHLTYEINDNGEAVITGGVCGALNSIVIPNTINGYRVVGIADRAFAYRQDIHCLRIEEGVRYIGAYAFAGCRHMDTPSLGEGLQAIGEGAFRDNLFTGRIVSRGDVFLPGSIMSIGKEAFDCCSHLQYMRLPKYADIDSSAFEGTPWQEERDELCQIRGDCLVAINENTNQVLNIPYGVTRLANEEGPRLLIDDVSRQTVYEEIILPDTLTEIRGQSLEGIKVKRIEIPGGVKYIPIGFLRYGEVSELVLSEGIEVIGPGALSKVDDMISKQDTEDTGMTNSYFPCKEHTSLNGYAQYYDKQGEFIEEIVDAEIIKVKEYEEGNVYKLTIYIIAETNPWYFKEDDFLSIYFYVTDDKIYRMYPYCQLEPGGTSISFYNDDDLLVTVFDTEEKLQSRGVFMPVCQEEDMQEEFYSIKQVGNKITYHYFEIDINKDRGSEELFVWEKGKGLVEFETGWGAGMMSSVHVNEICEVTKDE